MAVSTLLRLLIKLQSFVGALSLGDRLEVQKTDPLLGLEGRLELVSLLRELSVRDRVDLLDLGQLDFAFL